MKNILTLFFLLISLSFYGQSDTISVVKHSDNDLIIPKNLKVVYRGLPNQLIIDVPNCKSFTAIGDGLTLLSKNLYNLNPTYGLEVIITIDIVLKNNKKIIEKHSFKIRNVAGLEASINYFNSENVKLYKNQLNRAKVNVYILDKNIDFKFIVTEFTINLSNGKKFIVKGNNISNKTFSEISKLISRNDKIFINGIKFFSSGNDILFCKINPINITIY